MNRSRRVSDPASARPPHDEADIGSGEKTPADHETDEMIRQIPPLAGKRETGAATAPADARPSGGGHGKQHQRDEPGRERHAGSDAQRPKAPP